MKEYPIQKKDIDEPLPQSHILTHDQVREALSLPAQSDAQKEREKIPTLIFSGAENAQVLGMWRNGGIWTLKNPNEMLVRFFRESVLNSALPRVGGSSYVSPDRINDYIAVIHKLKIFSESIGLPENHNLAFRVAQVDPNSSTEDLLAHLDVYGGKASYNSESPGICVEFESPQKCLEYFRGSKNIFIIYDGNKLAQLTDDEKKVDRTNWVAGYGVKAKEGYALRDTIMGVIIFE